MSNDFQIIFQGQTLDGFTVDQTKENIARLYKTNVAGIERLFTGSTVIIKDKVDEPTAIKYATALRQQGAKCEVRRIPVAAPVEPAPAPTPVPASAPAKFETSPAPEVVTSPVQNPEPVAAASVNNEPAQAVSAAAKCTVELDEAMGEMSAISVAEVGSTIVEFQTNEAPDINIDSLSMAQAGETLVEHETVAEPEINIDNLSIDK